MNHSCKVICLLAIALLASAASSKGESNQYWVGGSGSSAADQDFTLPANWNTSTSPNGNRLFINMLTGNYPKLTSDVAIPVWDLMIGRDDGWPDYTHTTGPGRFDQSAGTINLVGTLLIGKGDAGLTSYYNMSGGSLNGGNLKVGAESATSNGEWNLSGTAAVSTPNWLQVGDGGGTGVMRIDDTASVSIGNWIAIGNSSGGSGKVYMTGGTMSATNWLAVSNSNGGDGYLEMTGNSRVSTSDFQIAYGGIGVVNVGGSSTDSAVLHAGLLELGAEYSGTADTDATLNIKLGGTVETNQLVSSNYGGSPLSSIVNFDGGTLKALANQADFVKNSGSSLVFQANIKAGGAIIDTNGFNVGIAEALLTGVTSGTDGGLKKIGTGTLTLNGYQNTYTGPTDIQAGGLAFGYTTFTTGGTVTMRDGTTLTNTAYPIALNRSLILGESNLVIGYAGYSLGSITAVDQFSALANGNKVVVTLSGITTDLVYLAGTQNLITYNSESATVRPNFVTWLDGVGKTDILVADNHTSAVTLTVANMTGNRGWQGTIDSLWSKNGNWKENLAPNGTTAKAWFDDVAGLTVVTHSVSLDQNVTLSSMLFDGTGYDIQPAASQTITLQTTLADNTQIQSLQGTNTIGANLVLAGSGTIIGVVDYASLVINGSIGDDATPRTLAKTGNGSLTLGGDNSSFLGEITVAGTLAVSNANGLGQSPNLTLAAATLAPTGDGVQVRLNGTVTSNGSSQIASSVGTAGIMLQCGDQTTPNTTFNVQSDTLAVNSTVQDGVASDGVTARATNLTKIGAGKLVLSADNGNLTGNIIINGGTLSANASATPSLGRGHNTAPDRSIIVNAGGTLEFGASVIYGGHDSLDTPTIDIQGGTVRNTSGYMAINVLNLNNGTLAAGANAGEWASWNINGTVTSSGNSSMTWSDGGDWIMLHSGDDMTTPATTFDVVDGTLTVPIGLGDGRSSDGGAGFPSRATNLVKEGEGTMTLSGNSDSLTGNVIINAGTLAATAGYTASLGRGHDTAPDRSVIVNAGATLSFGAGDIYGGHATQNTPTIDIQGGTVTNTAGHMEFNILNLNNGTLTAGAHVENWGAWNFNGTITSHGTSIMDKTDANATIMLHSGDDMVTPSTTFDVADGSLAISLALTDGRGSDGGADFPVRATGLVKDGEGTMSLTVDPTYTGATEVLAGTLEVVNLTTSPTITVYDGATLTAASIVADTLTIGGTQPALPNAVPEPSTIVLLVLASVCMIFAASRRR